MILNKNVNTLNSKGYVILRNVIPKRLINETKKYAAELLRCKPDSKSITKSMARLESKDKKKFHDFCSSLGFVDPVLKTAYRNKISNIVQRIFRNKNVYLSDSCVFYNKAEVKRLQYDWHVEQSFYPNAEEVITLWYPWLYKVNEKNGTMIIAKDSNLYEGYKVKKIAKKNSLTQMKIDQKELDHLKFKHCNLEIGDAILFNLKVAHKTGNNTSGVPRTTMVLRYTDYNGRFNNPWTKSN